MPPRDPEQPALLTEPVQPWVLSTVYLEEQRLFTLQMSEMIFLFYISLHLKLYSINVLENHGLPVPAAMASDESSVVDNSWCRKRVRRGGRWCKLSFWSVVVL